MVAVNDNKVFVVIASFNGSKYIEKCIQSVVKNFKIIIVDNNSKDNTLNICYKYPHNELIHLNKNIGFGQANNIGIQKAISEGAEYVFLLNQDAYLGQDCIEKLIEVHQSNPEYGILSPMHLNGDGTNFDLNFSEYLKGISQGNILFDLLCGSTKKVYSLPFVNAAGWLLPKSTIERVGLFDPIFFHYGEDDNYCQRVRYNGLKVGVVPDAFIKHDRETVLNTKESLKFDEHKFERYLKIKYGDINIEPSLKQLKNHSRVNILKSALKLNYLQFKTGLSKLRVINRCIREISESRDRNKRNSEFN